MERIAAGPLAERVILRGPAEVLGRLGREGPFRDAGRVGGRAEAVDGGLTARVDGPAAVCWLIAGAFAAGCPIASELALRLRVMVGIRVRGGEDATARGRRDCKAAKAMFRKQARSHLRVLSP